MEHDELFDELRAANPFAGEGDTPQPKTSPDARFKEITMQPHDAPSTRRNPAAAPSPWRPMIAVPSALGLIAVIVAAALVFSAVTAPSAYALVTEAAQTSASFESGRIEIAIELREVPESLGGTVVVDYRYDGSDYAMSQDMSGLAGVGERDEVDELEAIRVNGIVYTKFPGFTDVDKYFEAPASDNDMWDEAGFGVNPETIHPEAIVDIIERGDDFSEVDSDEDDTTTYRGSVSLEVIEELGADNLPPGLSLLASDEDATDLPDMLGLTAVVKDGQIHRLIVDIVGDSPDGYTDATITTTFTELGEPQGITAPPADQIADESEIESIGLPEGMEELFEILDELEERRPGLCSEIWVEFDEATEPEFDEDLFVRLNAEFTACLVAEGEPDAAAAFNEVINLGR